jgi:hypothetical protein
MNFQHVLQTRIIQFKLVLESLQNTRKQAQTTCLANIFQQLYD